MVTVNLMPWREKRIQYQQKMWVRLLVGAVAIPVVITLILYLSLFYYAEQLNALHETIEPIATTESDANERAALMTVGTIQRLEQAGLQTNHLLDALAPRGNHVCLTEVTTQKDQLLLFGQARSVEEVERSFNKWKTSPALTTLQVERVDQAEHGFSFRMKAMVSRILPNE